MQKLKLQTSKTIIVAFLALVACQTPQADKQVQYTDEQLTRYVNPFIGTDGMGNTYPGATTPFGMVQLSPDIGVPGWNRIPGYFYVDNPVTGFSYTHLSGTEAGDLYGILVVPINSRFNKRIKENDGKPFSYFSHQSEKATAGHYAVDLNSYGIRAELTATPRVGVQCYTFPKDDTSRIMVDLGYNINWDKPTETYMKVVDDSTLEGYRYSTGRARDQKVYFVMKFSKPFAKSSLLSEKIDGKSQIGRAELLYTTAEGEQIVVKTALSMHSLNGVYKSMQEEVPHFAFDTYREAARALWEKQLQKITVTNDDEQ